MQLLVQEDTSRLDLNLLTEPGSGLPPVAFGDPSLIPFDTLESITGLEISRDSLTLAAEPFTDPAKGRIITLRADADCELQRSPAVEYNPQNPPPDLKFLVVGNPNAGNSVSSVYIFGRDTDQQGSSFSLISAVTHPGVVSEDEAPLRVLSVLREVDSFVENAADGNGSASTEVVSQPGILTTDRRFLSLLSRLSSFFREGQFELVSKFEPVSKLPEGYDRSILSVVACEKVKIASQEAREEILGFCLDHDCQQSGAFARNPGLLRKSNIERVLDFCLSQEGKGTIFAREAGRHPKLVQWDQVEYLFSETSLPDPEKVNLQEFWTEHAESFRIDRFCEGLLSNRSYLRALTREQFCVYWELAVTPERRKDSVARGLVANEELLARLQKFGMLEEAIPWARKVATGETPDALGVKIIVESRQSEEKTQRTASISASERSNPAELAQQILDERARETAKRSTISLNDVLRKVEGRKSFSSDELIDFELTLKGPYPKVGLEDLREMLKESSGSDSSNNNLAVFATAAGRKRDFLLTEDTAAEEFEWACSNRLHPYAIGLANNQELFVLIAEEKIRDAVMNGLTADKKASGFRETLAKTLRRRDPDCFQAILLDSVFAQLGKSGSDFPTAGYHLDYANPGNCSRIIQFLKEGKAGGQAMKYWGRQLSFADNLPDDAREKFDQWANEHRKTSFSKGWRERTKMVSKETTSKGTAAKKAASAEPSYQQVSALRRKLGFAGRGKAPRLIELECFGPEAAREIPLATSMKRNNLIEQAMDQRLAKLRSVYFFGLHPELVTEHTRNMLVSFAMGAQSHHFAVGVGENPDIINPDWRQEFLYVMEEDRQTKFMAAVGRNSAFITADSLLDILSVAQEDPNSLFALGVGGNRSLLDPDIAPAELQADLQEWAEGNSDTRFAKRLERLFGKAEISAENIASPL